MNIQVKEMKLIFEIYGDTRLRRFVTDMNDNIIWDSEFHDSNPIDNSPEGLDAWEQQMRSMPFWNIVEHKRIVL